jgi:hypothetical protein
MFARKACYFFVRPKRTRLELCIFLGRTVKSPLIRKSLATSRTKAGHLLNIVHRDQVEAPLTDWIAEAYGLQDVLAAAGAPVAKSAAKKKTAPRAAGKRKSVRRRVGRKTNVPNRRR